MWPAASGLLTPAGVVMFLGFPLGNNVGGAA
jgi:hypothetical protein